MTGDTQWFVLELQNCYLLGPLRLFAQKTQSWYLLEILFKMSDETPFLF